MITIAIGTNSASAKNIVTLAGGAGRSIGIANLAGDTLNYFTNGVNGAPTALPVGNNVTLATPAYIQSQGRTTVQLTGGQYG